MKILCNISLVEVMRANGYEPERMPKGDGPVKYLCPFHDDHDASFFVDQKAKNGADAPGWGCYGCGRKGFGAIALQAALMGYDHSSLTAKQMQAVCQRLVDEHDVEIDDLQPTEDGERTEAIAPQECEFDLTPWTVQHLNALGFATKVATERRDGENIVKYAEEDKEPLYRCSIDREYWRGRGAARTAKDWGEIIEKEFNTFPVATFITSPVNVQNGAGKVSLKIPSRRTYPIFAMVYDWGIKKYEPRGNKSHKWYWSKSEGIATKVYGDSVAIAALQAAQPTTDAADKEPARPWFADSLKDRRHQIVVTERDSDKNPVKAKMKRLVLCSGPRDAMQMWAATDAHVLWLHNELAGIKDGVVEDWLRALLARMSAVAVDIYVCYDLDQTGMSCSASIALENTRVHWVRLPKEMTDITLPLRKGDEKARTLKDVTDFVTHFHPIMKRFAPDLRKANPSEALMRLLKNSLTMQFWIDKPTTKKDKDGEKETNVRYVLSVANLLQFLQAKGIRCTQDEHGQRAFYQLSFNNTYRYLDTARVGSQLESVCRTAMLNWIDAHITDDEAPYKANLVNTIFTGKGLDQRTMNTMPPTPINEHSWGEDFDTFFFHNTAVRVTKDTIQPIDYNRLQYVTNEECILPGDFTVVKQPWRIIINPQYEAEKKRHEEISKKCTTPAMRAAENRRWANLEQLWKYQLIMDKPLEEMPMHFRFLYNMGRIFWEKEAYGETLTATEKQMQDMHFINKVHAIGYAITRYRSRARQQIVHLTDYAVSDEQKASGRNGKSAIIDMISSVRPSSANVAGKSINGNNITLAILLGDVIAGVHSVVCIDELPDGFKAEELYNAPVTLVVKTLYKQPITLRGEDVPKLFIASNKPFDRSSGSTKGRIYPCFASDYYHAATDDGRWLDFAPRDEFFKEYGVSEVANGLPDNLLNELRNLLLACAQFFFQHPSDTILPPTETRSLRRELYAMTNDSGLTDWLNVYFEDTPDNPHLGQPIPPNEMAINLLDTEDEAVNYDTIEKAKKRIMKYLKPCLNRMGIVMDPKVVLNTATYRRQGGRHMKAWVTQLDENGKPIERTVKNKWHHIVSTGERVPRELSQHIYVHYFYRNRPGEVPTKPYEPGHEGDNDYVQAADEKDPEA
ncbi:MAG: hypothetical protein ACOCNM_00525 [Prevotella pectinovora]